MVRTLIVFFIAAAMIPYSAVSQNPEHPMRLGAYINYSGGVNSADVPQGIKNGFIPASSVDFGLTYYYGFTLDGSKGIYLDAGYQNYMFSLRYTGNEDFDYANNLSYFILSPQFHISSFIVGFAVGFPLGAEIEDASVEPDDDRLNAVFTGRIGVNIPMLTDPSGQLGLLIRAEYMFSDPYDGVYPFYAVKPPQTDNNCTVQDMDILPAIVSIGINYQFNLTGRR